jgi:hypothetical protein
VTRRLVRAAVVLALVALALVLWWRWRGEQADSELAASLRCLPGVVSASLDRTRATRRSTSQTSSTSIPLKLSRVSSGNRAAAASGRAGESMSLKWTLLKTIQREPDNALPCYALADLLEEGG